MNSKQKYFKFVDSFSVSKYKLLISAVFIFILIFFFSPSINFVFESTVSSSSQLFYSSDVGYSEDQSQIKSVTVGVNKLSFPLSNDLTKLRWDPIFSDGEVLVNRIFIGFLGIEKNIDVNNAFINMNGLFKNLDATDNYHLISKDRLPDPQLFIRDITKDVLYLKLKFAFILLVFSIIFHLINFLIKKERIIFDGKVFDFFDVKCFFVLSVIGCVFYSYFLVNYSLSIDDENALMRVDPRVWIGQGRWTSYLIEEYLITNGSIPFLPYLILILCFSFSYILIVRCLKFPTDWKFYFLYPLYIAFPTWWLIVEFSSNVPTIALGIFLVSIGVFFAFNNVVRLVFLGKNINLSQGISVLLIATAIGGYQSFLFLFIAVALSVILVVNIDDNLHAKLLAKILSVGTVSFFSVIVYFTISKIFLLLYGGNTSYIESFISFEPLISNPLGLVKRLFNFFFQIYSGDSFLYGNSVPVLFFVVISPLFFIFTKRVVALKVFLWFLILLSPFFLNWLTRYNLPLRSYVALPYVIWFCAAFLVYTSKRIRAVNIILISFLLIQITSINSNYIAAATLTQQNDEKLANLINTEILKTQSDGKKVVKIDIYGKKDILLRHKVAWSSVTSSSFFSWDDGNIERMVSYMRALGINQLIPLNENERIKMTPFFLEMPVWPISGSVKEVNGVVLVKIGNNPDPVHAKY